MADNDGFLPIIRHVQKANNEPKIEQYHHTVDDCVLAYCVGQDDAMLIDVSDAIAR